MKKTFLSLTVGIFTFCLWLALPTNAQAATTLANQVKGKILLQVELHGEAWYVYPEDGKRYYMQNGVKAYQIMRWSSLGISNSDIAKIPVGIAENFQEGDSDNDGLSDKLEQGLGTNEASADSDNDGQTDKAEILNNTDPLGSGTLNFDQTLVNRLKGKVVLQVNDRGQAWYVNPADGKRYYMKDGDTAYNMMRFFGLGISNANIAKIPGVLSGEYGMQYTLDENGVYFFDKKLEGVDLGSFHLITSGKLFSGQTYIYTRDLYNIYINDLKIPSANAQTFEVVEPAERGYSKDSNSAFRAVIGYFNQVEAIPNSDPATFVVLEKIGFTKDKNYVYYQGQIIQNADPETFTFIGNHYTKDAVHVFYSQTNLNKIVVGADLATFEEFASNDTYGKDKNNVYYQGDIVTGADPATFQP